MLSRRRTGFPDSDKAGLVIIAEIEKRIGEIRLDRDRLHLDNARLVTTDGKVPTRAAVS